MKLAIRTSSGPYGVGLFTDCGSLLSCKEAEATPTRPGNVGDLLQDMLAANDLRLSDVSELFVDLGPGGLSSTRAGVSFANALSFGLGAKLCGVSALDVQFLDVKSPLARPTLSMRPALGQKVFWAFYDQNVLAGKGCGLFDELVADLLGRFNHLLVIGPLQRLRIKVEGSTNIEFFNVDPPSLESLFAASKQFPLASPGTFILEPIASIEGL